MQRRALLGGLPLALLAACSPPVVWAPEAEIERVRYRDPGPAHLALMTMKETANNAGAHTGLLISGRERVIFDPAGNFAHPQLPERNDVVFGVSPRVEEFYIAWHARTTFYVVRQRIEVPLEVADLALELAFAEGPVPKAQCTRAASAILTRLPGIGPRLRRTWFPNALQSQFETLPGVVTSTHREDDDPEAARASFAAAFRL